MAVLKKYPPFLILLLLTACIDPFEIGEDLQGTPLLVVDGKITNQAGPHQVALRYSSTTLDGFESPAISGAQVTITNQEGQEIILTEAEPGVYYSDESIRGQAGDTYQLHITLPDGKRYASQPETMPAVTAIDSLYAVVESRTALSTLNTLVDRWGLQIYVNSGSNSTMPGFYRWEWEDTYQIASPLTLPPPSSLPSTCWLSSRGLRDINIASTQRLARDVVERQPITFVSKRGFKLQVRYSILVRQYSLSRNTYTYWSRIKEQIEGAGSVFDPPPAQIAGNIYHVDDQNEIVLGYFQASSVTERRFFIRRSEVPQQPGGPVNAFPECQGVGAEPSPYCYDCSLVSGATTERPSFW